MISVPLMTALLIIVAVLVQALAIFVTFKIRRKSGEKAEEENITTEGTEFHGGRGRF
jgi:heme/copper-type cytochrome/quinol oxidase subunit 2